MLLLEGCLLKLQVGIGGTNVYFVCNYELVRVLRGNRVISLDPLYEIFVAGDI